MSLFRSVKYAALATVVSGSGWVVYAQATATPTNDAPNPYQTIEGHFKLPEGRTWGSTSAVDIARDGRSIWVAERCGANTCVANRRPGRCRRSIRCSRSTSRASSSRASARA